jgi:hypothetical protein
LPGTAGQLKASTDENKPSPLTGPIAAGNAAAYATNVVTADGNNVAAASAAARFYGLSMSQMIDMLRQHRAAQLQQPAAGQSSRAGPGNPEQPVSDSLVAETKVSIYSSPRVS